MIDIPSAHQDTSTAAKGAGALPGAQRKVSVSGVWCWIMSLSQLNQDVLTTVLFAVLCRPPLSLWYLLHRLKLHWQFRQTQPQSFGAYQRPREEILWTEETDWATSRPVHTWYDYVYYEDAHVLMDFVFQLWEIVKANPKCCIDVMSNSISQCPVSCNDANITTWYYLHLNDLNTFLL